MNQQQLSEARGESRWLDEWEASPRDGPAVFVVDAAAFDQYGTRWGRWIDPTQPAEVVEREIEEVIGIEGTADGNWAIIDQTGLGEAMIPEQLAVTALHRLATGSATTIERSSPPESEPMSDVERFASMPGEYWGSTSELAQDFIITSGVLSVVEGLPAGWDYYLTFDLDKLGHDLAIKLGGTVDSVDGAVFIPKDDA